MKQTPSYSALQKTRDAGLSDASFRGKFQQMFPTRKANNNTMDVSSVIETAFLFQGFPEADSSTSSCKSDSSSECADYRSSSLELSLDQCRKPVGHCYGVPELTEEALDEVQCNQVCSLLRNHLLRAESTRLQCNLMVPRNLLPRISEDVVRMSHCEPCGLRGCVLFVTVQRGETSHRLGKIECDPDTVATFELHLTLKEDTKHWFNLGDLLLQLVAGCSPGPVRDDIYVSPGYQLVKKKLYRPN